MSVGSAQPLDSPRRRSQPPSRARRTALAPRADVLLARWPLADPETPATADLDLLVIANVDRLLPERLWLPADDGNSVPTDVIWYPRRIWDDLPALAWEGVMAHRAAGSRVVLDATGRAEGRLEELRLLMAESAIQATRIAGYLELGRLTVREMGITWDFPALALFWLHMAYAALVAAQVDAQAISCPNVYTRPMPYVRKAGLRAGGLEDGFVRTLRLNADPRELEAPLRRVQRMVWEHFPEPDWPANMRSTTRYEYRYYRDDRELEWRIATAREMMAAGDPTSAVFYLRCWAYFLACLPLAYRRAGEGIDVSFVRPACVVRPELAELCPEVIDDLSFLLGGPGVLAVADVVAALDAVVAARRRALALIQDCGVRLPPLHDWQPFRQPPT